MSGDKKILDRLKETPKIDGLAIGALALNIFAIYTISNINDFQELLEPFASNEIMVLQFSGLMGALYLIEFMGDEESSSSRSDPFGGSSNSEGGGVEWLSGFLEHGYIGTAVDAGSLAVVFLGYQHLSENAAYGTSITQISFTPEVIAMQVSALMMLNFGLFLIGDLLSRSS